MFWHHFRSPFWFGFRRGSFLETVSVRRSGSFHVRFGSGQNQQAPLRKPPGEGNSQNQQILPKIEPERAPEMKPKHRKSLPNGRQQGGAFGVLVVFHLVRISYVLASFPEPILVRFSTKFADSENSLPQGAFLKSLLEASYAGYRPRNS